MKKNYKVYVHIVPKEITDYEHDMLYFGITKQNIYKRWSCGHGYDEQPFGKAIRKYGWENIKHIVLIENIDQEMARQCEIYLIQKYKSNYREYGYNRTDGGDIMNYPTIKVNQYDLNGKYIKTWDSITEAQEFYNLSNHISDCCKGIRASIGGYQWRFYDENNFCDYIDSYKQWQKPISQYSLSGKYIRTWEKGSMIENELGYLKGNICSCCQGNYNSAYGYIWKYSDGSTNDIVSNKKQMDYYYLTLPVIQLSKDNKFIKEWEKLSDLKSIFGRTCHIRDCCLGKYKQMYGYIWKFKVKEELL